MKKEAWSFVCQCGCGEKIPIPKRIDKNKIPQFKNNHWWRLDKYKEIIKTRNAKRVKLIPNISPCVGRRFRGGKYWSRVLMEKHIGRILLPSEHVHHINGDKTDDRIENLIILTKEKHTSLHKSTSETIEYNCDHCGKKLSQKMWKYKRSKKHFCSKECFDNSSLKRKLTPKEYNRYFYENSKKKKI